ncbi:MAG: DUF4326 domain-containing protein [Pseudomonadota bacterium]
MQPQRIQRKRTKGWRMPENTTYVGRPSKWGNKYTVSLNPEGRWIVTNINTDVVISSALTQRDAKQIACNMFKALIHETRPDLTELKGKNLACWCKPGDPCHADLLLEYANATN